MTLTTITVPDRYSYVLLAGIGTGWLTLWQSYGIVARYRKMAKIPYPQVYAEVAEVEKSLDAKRFNCAQRAHQNTMENLPQILFCLMLGGLKYPTLTAGLGATWLVGRVIYTLGYATGDPKKRTRGGFSGIAAMGLTLAATWSAVEMVVATL